MNKKIYLLLIPTLLITKIILAQVPVREEPRHHVVLQNEYIRLLDVWLPPGDTTMFHLHEIPSFFVVLSETKTESQVKGENWVKAVSTPGYNWFNGFTTGPLIHRVCNTDSNSFHVMDIEILSNTKDDNNKKPPQPFELLLENEKLFAYKINLVKGDKKQIVDRGPHVVIVVSGPGTNIQFSNNKEQDLSQGKFIWIEPKEKFWLQNKGNNETSLIVVELK